MKLNFSKTTMVVIINYPQTIGNDHDLNFVVFQTFPQEPENVCVHATVCDSVTEKPSLWK